MLTVIIDGQRHRIGAVRDGEKITGPGVRDLVQHLGPGGSRTDFDIEDGVYILRTCRLTDIFDDASTGRVVWIRSVHARPDLWTAAESALLANGAKPDETTMRLLQLAREGHPNRTVIVDGLLGDVTGCACGEDVPCSSSDDTPERIAARAALTALLAHVKGDG